LSRGSEVCLQSKNTSSMDVELEFFKGQRENPIYAQPLNKTKEPKTKLSLFSAYVCTPPSTTRWGPFRRFMTSITSSHLCRASQAPEGCRTDSRVPDACRSPWHSGDGRTPDGVLHPLHSGQWERDLSPHAYTHADTNDGDLGRS
jgi:hypothetical protein